MNQSDIIELLEKKISISKKTSASQELSHNYRKGKWTLEEDEKLRYYLHIFGERNWKKVSEQMDGRSPIQCLHRWTKILKPGLVKGPWTVEEDKKLIEWVHKEGALKWSRAAQYIPGRSGKQCRERWLNNLNPNLKKSNWNDEEDELIFTLYKKYGSAWSKIARHFEGRTENSIKNRFYSTIRRLALDRSRQNQEVNSIHLKSEDGKESIFNPILEKFQGKNQKKENRSEGMTLCPGEVQSIIKELTQNFRDYDKKEAMLIKKEYVEEIRAPKKIDLCADDELNQENILNNLMALEKGFNNIRNEAIDLEEQRKSNSIGEMQIKCNENNINEIFGEFLKEEQMIDQNILHLIRKLKNIECLLMDKMKENLEQEMNLKQEQMDLNNSYQYQETNNKRRFPFVEETNPWNSKKVKAN